MSHFHFPLLPEYRNRIIQMGEEKWRVKDVGMHELNSFKNKDDDKLQLKKNLTLISKSLSTINFSPCYT